MYGVYLITTNDVVTFRDVRMSVTRAKYAPAASLPSKFTVACVALEYLLLCTMCPSAARISTCQSLPAGSLKASWIKSFAGFGYSVRLLEAGRSVMASLIYRGLSTLGAASAL